MGLHLVLFAVPSLSLCIKGSGLIALSPLQAWSFQSMELNYLAHLSLSWKTGSQARAGDTFAGKPPSLPGVSGSALSLLPWGGQSRQAGSRLYLTGDSSPSWAELPEASQMPRDSECVWSPNLETPRCCYGGLNGGPAKEISMLQFPEPGNVSFHGKRVFADVIKNLEVKRSSWIIQICAKSNDKCPHKGHTGYLSERRRPWDHGGGDWSAAAANEGMPGATRN